MERWKPRVELTPKEEFIMKRLNRVRALFGLAGAGRVEDTINLLAHAVTPSPSVYG